MVFQNFKNKHAGDSVFSPEDFVNYLKKTHSDRIFIPPENVILCYSKTPLEYVKEQYRVSREERFTGEMYLFGETGNTVGILGNFGIGAPIVVTIVEELIALGVKRFISIGMAGTLQKSFDFGEVIVCEKAIRDEGTSYHYLEAGKYAYASGEVTDRIKWVLDRQGQKYVVGTSWTIDAPYRETVAEAKQYQEEGVTTVEMEASALFAVAQYRSVQMGAIFTVSDSLAELQWSPEFHSEKTRAGMEIITRAAIEALAG